MSTKEKNMDERIAFGNSLSEKRRESGFSQEELGLKIGKSSNAVSRYENAENTMDVHTFAKTVNALKATDLRTISLTRKKIWKVRFLKYMQLRIFTQRISRKMTRAAVFWNMLLEH